MISKADILANILKVTLLLSSNTLSNQKVKFDILARDQYKKQYFYLLYKIYLIIFVSQIRYK
jgi:hypothetical protein